MASRVPMPPAPDSRLGWRLLGVTVVGILVWQLVRRVDLQTNTWLDKAVDYGLPLLGVLVTRFLLPKWKDDLKILWSRCLAIWNVIFYPDTHVVLVNKVNELFTRHTDANRRLLQAFFKRYSLEEAADIGGTSVTSKHFIVTNFVAYGELVRALVEEALRCRSDENHDVICFTTLSMPIPKWYNYHEPLGVPTPKAFPYVGVSRTWSEEYTDHMRSFVAKDGVLVERGLLAITDSFASTVTSAPLFPFMAETQMKALANAWILVPTENGQKNYGDLKPLVLSTLPQMFADTSFLAEVQALYAGVDRAHLIVPEEIEPRAIPNYAWSRVGDAFIEMFHRHPEHAITRVFDKTEWEHWFQQKKMPEDLFLIGSKPKGRDGQEAWHFCLAADVDSRVDKISLEFITSKLNEGRWGDILSFVDCIRSKQITSPGLLKNWMKP